MFVLTVRFNGDRVFQVVKSYACRGYLTITTLSLGQKNAPGFSARGTFCSRRVVVDYRTCVINPDIPMTANAAPVMLAMAPGSGFWLSATNPIANTTAAVANIACLVFIFASRFAGDCDAVLACAQD